MNVGEIVIEGLVKRFGEGKPAIDGISATLSAGGITGLVGPDGAGKTTLMRLMAGLLLPTEGSVILLGHDSVKDAAQVHDMLGYMPQKFGLYEDLSVRENLNLYAELRGLSGKDKEESFRRMLEFTQLAPFTSRLAGRLSGGMKQKLGLACALLAQPKILLLDEPSVGVDPISRRELWKMVQEMAGGGVIVVWSTAYLDEAEQCDSVLLLDEGKLLFQGHPRELTKRAEGRSFLFLTDPAERRRTLMGLLKKRGVMDGVVQGENVRVLLKSGDAPPEVGVEMKPTPARFEDAYIDLLGGLRMNESALAARMEKKTAGGPPPIEAENLSKRFGDFTAAEDMNFTIRRGEIFGLLGPNGAGKSTTFKMLCGLIKPSEGTARILGLDLTESTAEARAHIGYMAQKFSLYGDLSVRQNLAFFSGIYGLSGRARKARIEEMVEIFHLGDYLAANAGTLPLGFKQRLSLACAVMHEPDILFLDEPTSGVDPITRREFWLHINGMVEKGVTIMVTTHFMDEAEYCDRIALIYRGRNIASGAPDDLKAKIKSRERPDPTLEDAFIALIEQSDAGRKEAA